MFKGLFRYASACAVALAFFFCITVAARAQVAVTIDGNETDFSPPPTVNAGRVFVPLRGVFERLGASVVYANGTINAQRNGRNISLHIGSTQATVDGQSQTLDVAPYIVGASTYVPLRFISQALGASVNYDDSERVVSINSSGGGQQYSSQADAYQSQYAPPPNPDYQQPSVPAPNYVWQPGYWAYGPNGYYWVPGTWVAPPQQGYLWTPGYWHQSSGIFGFIQGFWAKTVGFYGGVNYGNGYNGNGYNGAQWSGNQLQYNTSATQVDPSSGYATYAAPVAPVMSSMAHVSYNGGSNGLQARPTTTDLSVLRAHHLPPTPVQVEHVAAAATDRRLLAKVNNNVPPVLVVAKPLTRANPAPGRVTVEPSDAVTKTPAAPAAAHAAPVVRTAPVAKPAAAEHPAAVVRPTAVAHPAPVEHPAPVVHPAAPIVSPAPAHPADEARPAPPKEVKPAAPKDEKPAPAKPEPTKSP